MGRLTSLIVVAILAAFIGHLVWPGTKEIIVPGPPAKPDTVMVHDSTIRVDSIFVPKIVERVKHDTINKVVREFITDTIRVECAAFGPETYVTGYLAGSKLGDKTWITGEHVRGDSAGIIRQRFTEQLFTAGYLSALTTQYGTVQTAWTPFPKIEHYTLLDKARDGLIVFAFLRTAEAIAGW